MQIRVDRSPIYSFEYGVDLYRISIPCEMVIIVSNGCDFCVRRGDGTGFLARLSSLCLVFGLPSLFSRIVCKIYSDKRLIKFGVNVPERWFGYLPSYSSALPFHGIGISCTLNTTMDRRILGLFSSTLLTKLCH
ncbi:hypothetical protein H5410_063289 [Solanum commersonii]|uniref:Uncharacterized protein n=1 Tax=Solanum commersonii TaxID=4109 RepID=A0A9J5WCU5_SOLCO|nr:hypothetical protein H5410_063289 [Solanum commersonii]